MKRTHLVARLLGLLVLAAAVSACSADLTVKNGPAGDETWRVRPPWNTEPAPARRTSTRTSTTHPDGTKCQDDVDTCEGNTCRLPARAR